MPLYYPEELDEIRSRMAAVMPPGSREDFLASNELAKELRDHTVIPGSPLDPRTSSLPRPRTRMSMGDVPFA